MTLPNGTIRKLAAADRVSFKKHSLIRMHQRHITVDDVRTGLINGQIIENYVEDKPLPTCLILGYTGSGRPIHAVVAIDDVTDMLWIITAYEPETESWEDGFRVRRKR